jgi:acetyl-CoA acetyltransferase
VSQKEVVVISALRSPFGKCGGALKEFTLPSLGGVVVAECIRRAGIAPDDVEEVATGVNLPGADRSIVRQSGLILILGCYDRAFPRATRVCSPCEKCRNGSTLS